MTGVLVREGTIGGAFQDIPVRPPEGGLMTRTWDEL